MMSTTIDEAVKQKCPRVALGCVSGVVRAHASPEVLTAELAAAAQKIVGLPEPKAVQPRAGDSGRATRLQSAGERSGALSRVGRGFAAAGDFCKRDLPQINAVVDVINLVSVECRMPIGLYDLVHLQGDVVFRTGRAGETYKGIGKYDLNLEDLPLFADAEGPHGSATSDSERTMVTAETTRVLAIIVAFGGGETLGAWTQRMIELLERYAEGREFVTTMV